MRRVVDEDRENLERLTGGGGEGSGSARIGRRRRRGANSRSGPLSVDDRQHDSAVGEPPSRTSALPILARLDRVLGHVQEHVIDAEDGGQAIPGGSGHTRPPLP